MALGSDRPAVVRLIVGQTLRRTGIGLALGLGPALVGGRWLSSLLFQVDSRDPAVLVAVALVLCRIETRRGCSRVRPQLPCEGAVMPTKAMILSVLATALLSIPGFAQGEVCQRFGPQAPRDISDHDGDNPVVFSPAPAADKMHLCDIHFHKHAEHRGPGFETPAGSGTLGGYRCDGDVLQDDAEMQVCENVSPGDTIEVHWVYTTCDVDPGPKLDSCSSKSCGNPQLRVETQVFRVTRGEGVDFGAYTPSGEDTVSYLGSTTGDSYTEKCSPLQVTWSVPDGCMNVDFDSLGRWCGKGNNPYDETHAHGVRPLVTDLELLSKIP